MIARKNAKYEKRDSYVDSKGRVRTRYYYPRGKGKKTINPINKPYDKAYANMKDRLGKALTKVAMLNNDLEEALIERDKAKELNLFNIIDKVMTTPFTDLSTAELEVLKLLVAGKYLRVNVTPVYGQVVVASQRTRDYENEKAKEAN